MYVLMDYFASCQAGYLDKASETPYNKRKSSMKHDNGRPKKVNTSSSTRRTLDTSTEESIVVVVTPFVGIVSSKFIPSETHLHSNDNSSSFPSITLISPTHNPNVSEQVHSVPAHTSEQVHSEIVSVEPPVSAPQTINPNNAF